MVYLLTNSGIRYRDRLISLCNHGRVTRFFTLQVTLLVLVLFRFARLATYKQIRNLKHVLMSFLNAVSTRAEKKSLVQLSISSCLHHQS
jgi:hypothetical protein